MILLMALSPTPALGVATQVLAVQCECGVHFAWPSHVSLAECPGCARRELWHKVEPRPADGMWSEPVMNKPVCTACGAECSVGRVFPNGDMEAWIVCASCYRAHENDDESEVGT